MYILPGRNFRIISFYLVPGKLSEIGAVCGGFWRIFDFGPKLSETVRNCLKLSETVRHCSKTGREDRWTQGSIIRLPETLRSWELLRASGMITRTRPVPRFPESLRSIADFEQFPDSFGARNCPKLYETVRNGMLGDGWLPNAVAYWEYNYIA